MSAPIPRIARCVCGELVIDRGTVPREGRFWCRECLDFVEQLVAVPEVVGYVPRLPPDGLDLERWLEGLRLSLTDQALERSRGNKAKAARLLGLKRTALVERLKAWARAGVMLA